MKKKRWIFLAVLIIVLAGLTLFGAKTLLAPEKSVDNSSNKPGFVDGTIVCLPHKNEDGPQTLECAFGLKDEVGVYYGLRDTTSDYSIVSSAPMNVRVRVSGSLEPQTSETYKSVGVIHVTDIEVLE